MILSLDEFILKQKKMYLIMYNTILSFILFNIIERIFVIQIDTKFYLKSKN